MTNWPESFHHNSVEFRAPPPSPVASGRRSSVANDEILTEFLHHSLRVPDLVLPDHVQNSKIQILPKIDYKLLDSILDHEISNDLDLISRTGCFELVNHGINDQIVRSVANIGAGIFDLSPEKKAVMFRSGDRNYGFDEETSEEFVWCRDEEFRLKLEAMLPIPYSNFSEKFEILASEIEKISGMILNFLMKNIKRKSSGVDNNDLVSEKRIAGSICYLYRHHQDVNTMPNDNRYADSLRYDMIRMLIRGSEHSHTLSVHVCNGSSEFHVYSKKGWVSFCPERDALVVTIGDQLQKWSEGKYKHVMGRPISKDGEDCISMAFMYNPPPHLIPMKEEEKKKTTTISIGHQVLLVFILFLFFKFYL